MLNECGFTGLQLLVTFLLGNVFPFVLFWTLAVFRGR